MSRLKGVIVLIVDDEPLLRDFIIDEFESRGAVAFHATGGKAAEAILLANVIHVVISDIRMPRGDGPSLLRWIKEQDFANPPLFIFVSGYSDLSVSLAMNEGALGVFDKPTNWDEVESLIVKSLPRS